ncbi:MAG: HAD family phosphatase [Lachnospiraceae bacterium]|nr:HAD family phosphatase [Lachnospiraceae bacterium]
MIKGAIFDLDGTLLDSTGVWGQIDIDFLGKHGHEVPPDYVEIITPMTFEETAIYTIERFHLSATPEEVMAEWNEMAYEAYANQVKIRAGTKEVLAWLQEQGIPAGVATSNIAPLFEPCLRRNGIYDYFHSFTETKEVERGKESPDIYIKAAEKLGCAPSECVVFEDILPAMKSAKKGGFITIGVRETTWNYEPEVLKGCCDYFIEEIHDALVLLNRLK